jgi:polyisoprenoid-binding protein YceI
MKKLILVIFLGFLAFNLSAQKVFLTKDAKINFNSSTPIEDIIAESSQATAVIDIEKNALQFSVLTTSFKFRRALMEEHFNENYIESPKFPKATFKGKITSIIDWSSDKMAIVDVKGDLTMHGVTKEYTFQAQITPGKDKIAASATLKITPEQFNIPIPSAVREKIAKEVALKIDATFVPYH